MKATLIVLAGLLASTLPALAEDTTPAATAAAGDPALGEKVFVKCRSCHQIGENAHNSTGPELNGVIGRHTGSVPDYNYTSANKNSGLTWDEKTFHDYIKNPQAKIPGTKMTFAGLSKESDISNLTAYLKQFGHDGKKH
jgi:cytochrome c